MRIDLNDPLVFEKWRELYSVMTDAEHIEFCNAAESMWPEQKHFNPQNFERLFRVPSLRVLEIGGWKGELAHHCLTKFKIEEWMNVDFCDAAAKKTVPMGSLPYIVHTPKKINWFKDTKADAFDVCLSAHTIEHLSDGHLVELLDAIQGIPTIMFEAPISAHGNDWRGYCGTHILKMGWNAINIIMVGKGYTVSEINPTCYLYERR